MVKTETDRKQLGPLNTLTFISLSQIIQLSFIYNVIQWYAIKYACHFTERPNSNEIFGDMQNGTVFGVLCKNDVLRYCMFYGFLRVSRDLEINRLKVRELFVRRHVRLI
jgi:hypothetical protein